MRKWRLWNPEGSLENRAPRHPTCDFLRYRLVNELVWQEGRLENISASGVLFRAEGPDGLPERGTALELSFTVPREMGGDGETVVLSRAYTVRRALPEEPGAAPALAAKIAGYMLPLEGSR
jgi:hypothetical protein